MTTPLGTATRRWPADSLEVRHHGYRFESIIGADADGLARNSPQLLKFKQFQDAVCSVQQEFAEASASDVGEFSDDEAVRRHWREVAEPAFRERLAALEREWVLEGYKHEIVTAQNEQIVPGAKSPLATWLDWKANFDSDLDSQTGAAAQIEVFPTSFAPDTTRWTTAIGNASNSMARPSMHWLPRHRPR